MYQVAKEFAEKDHSEFDLFVVIIISHGQGNDIWDVDGGKVSLEQVMTEYTATKCPSLRGKPKMFFVERVTFVQPPSVEDGSIQAQCSTDRGTEPRPAFPLNVGNNCPEGADFLLTWMTSAVDKAKPVPEDLSIQVRILVKEVNKPSAANDLVVTKFVISKLDWQKLFGLEAIVYSLIIQNDSSCTM